MSGYARINMVLIASKNLLPSSIMFDTFNECLSEVNGKIVNSQLVINNSVVGKILLADRIVVQTTASATNLFNQTEELRQLFTRRSAVAYQDYQNSLEEKAIEMKKSMSDQIALSRLIDSIRSEKLQSEIAYKRQQKDNCIALKEELIEEAEKQGYDVIDNSKDEIELQFVKRVY